MRLPGPYRAGPGPHVNGPGRNLIGPGRAGLWNFGLCRPLDCSFRYGLAVCPGRTDGYSVPGFSVTGPRPIDIRNTLRISIGLDRTVFSYLVSYR